MPTEIYLRSDLSGQKFNLLSVRKYSFSKGGQRYWECLCDCGNTVEVRGDCLKNGNTRSCGCLNKKLAAERGKKMMTKHGKSRTRLYRIWLGMRDRCERHKNRSYKDYGFRDIRVCHEWGSFYCFEEWAVNSGYLDTLTLDRKDPNGDYLPVNCRWITKAEQGKTKRNSIFIEHNGVRLHLNEWAKRLGVKYHTLYQRYALNNDPSFVLRPRKV